MKRTNVWLRLDQKEKLKKNFEKTGVRPSEAIRRAVDLYFERRKRDNSEKE